MTSARAGLVFLVSAGLWASAQAAPGTSSLTATASVGSNCSVTTTPVAFNTYDPIGANLASPLYAGNGAVTVTCVKGTAPVIALGLGAHAAGAVRRMSNGSDFLEYELYQPTGTPPSTTCSFPASAVWGSGASALSTTSAPSKDARVYAICGTVPPGQNPSIGTYTDTVVATVTF